MSTGITLTDGKRIIVCGGRDYEDAETVDRVLSEHVPVPEVISDSMQRWSIIMHGDAPGADTLADYWAEGRDVGVDKFPADWAVHGRAAGPIRNEEMAQAGADLCIAFPGGKGTADMVRRARAHGIPVIEVPA